MTNTVLNGCYFYDGKNPVMDKIRIHAGGLSNDLTDELIDALQDCARALDDGYSLCTIELYDGRINYDFKA